MITEMPCRTLLKIARGVGLKNEESLNSPGKSFPYPGLLLSSAVLAMSLSIPQTVLAEGSVDLTANGGYRPYLDYTKNRKDQTLGYSRKTSINVYVNQGETINLGSSATGILKPDGTFTDGDILYRPPNSANFISCGKGVGFIANRAAEVNKTYTPCQVTVGPGQAGVWEVDFVSPFLNGTDGDDKLIPIKVGNDWTQTEKDVYVAAWDVTVTNNNQPIKGRVYANLLPLNLGTSKQGEVGLLNSILYIQTREGFVYKTNLNGLDPIGFIFFANNNGFEKSGVPAFISVQASDIKSNKFTLQDPSQNSTPSDSNITHKIFFNPPDPNLPATAQTPKGITWLREPTILPLPKIENFKFVGREGTPNQAGSTLGGNFSFDFSDPRNEIGYYSLVIDINKDGVFGNSNDVIIKGGATPSQTATVSWDGRTGTDADNDGLKDPAPASDTPYNAQLAIYVGEVHFPIIDAENNTNGIIVQRVDRDNPNIVQNSKIYYNDDNNLLLTNTFAPKPISTLLGIDSTPGAHNWGVFNPNGFNGFGNENGIDTWTSLIDPVPLAAGILVQSADLQITKTHTPEPALFPGPLTFTIDATNKGPSNGAAVPVTDTFPPGFTASNVTCAITTGTGSCGTVSFTGQNFSVPVNLNINANARITVQGNISATATNPLPNTATITRRNDVSDLNNNDNQSLDNRPNGTESVTDSVTLVKENPLLGVAKQAGTIVKNADGTFNVPYTVVLKNQGNVPLTNVQVTEDLATTFTGSGGFSIVTAPAVTGSLTAANASFNGGTNQNLLSGTQPLAVGQTATITFTVKVTPAGNLGPYNNTAVSSGTAPSGTNTTDQSENGLNPDPDQDGNPTNNNTPTPVSFPEEAILGVAKSAGNPVNNNDGTFTVPYTVIVSNLGNVALNNVQLTEDIFGSPTSTFTGAANATIVSPPTVVSGPLTAINANFNGNSDKNVLAGTQNLGFGQSATITFSVKVTPAGKLGTYNNIAVGNATTPKGVPTTDNSTDGPSVDPDNDKNPGNNSIPTPVNFPETPVLGVAKAAGEPQENGDGSFNIPYTVTVQNLGNITLSQVQVVENLSSTFAAPATFSIQGTPISSIPNLTINPTFDGKTNTNLLTPATSTLPFGGLATISFTVKLIPNGNLGPYNNNAVGSGSTPANTTVTDNSVDGTNTDPDGNGNPNEESPTVVRLEEKPSLGLAKSAGTIVNNGDGTYTVPYTITLQNFGNIPLSQVQVTENLTPTFPVPTSFTIEGTPTSSIPSLVINPTFNGSTNTSLLNANSTLPLGATATLNFNVKITPNGKLGPFNNNASGSGSTPGGKTVTDDSVNGTNPDLNGDKNPNNDSSPTTILLSEKPVLGVAKAAGIPVNNQNGTYTVPYTVVVSNLGDVPVSNVQITENLFGDANSTFNGTTAAVVPAAPTTTSGSLTANNTFNGSSNRNLLLGTQTLPVGQSATITFNVIVTPARNLGPYNNTAIANGTSPGGASVTDNSNNGTIVDPDGDKDPKNNDIPTPVSFTENPVLGVAKQAGTTTNNGDGTYTIPYTVVVSNMGDVPLENVQIVENLFGDVASTYNGATSIAIATPPAITNGLLTATNPAFNGNSDKNLLGANQTLLVGESATVTFAVKITPGNKLGLYNNIAVGQSNSPSGKPVTDNSTDGPNPDPDNNGPGDNNTPTISSFTETPVVGVAKAAAKPVNNGDSTFNITYTVLVRNMGDVPIKNIQVADRLFGTPDSTFSTANKVEIVTPPTVTGSVTAANASYNGNSNFNLLSGTDTLPLNGSATIIFTVKVTPGENFGPFANTAIGQGTSPGGKTVTDDSTDGNNVDPNNNGPADNKTPTTISFDENPALGLAKTAGVPVDNGDGTFSVIYTVLLQNLGDVPLRNIQVIENLFGDASSTFKDANAIAIPTPPTIIIGSLKTVNPNFNGNSDKNLLAGTEILPIGEKAQISFTVKVTPGNNFGPYNNTAIGEGTSPGGAKLTDESTEGTNVDPEGDGSANNATPTPVSFKPIPLLGLAKAAGEVVDNGDGTFTIPYTIIVRNQGSLPLNNVQVTENLLGSPDSTFKDAKSIQIVAPPTITSGTLTGVNPNFDGQKDQNLLLGTETLALNTSATITFSVKVTPQPVNLGPFNNTAVGSATSPNGEKVTDLSTDGSNTDANGNNNPNDDSQPSSVAFVEKPTFSLVKTITNVTRNSTPVSGINYSDISAFVSEPKILQAIKAANLPTQGITNIPGTIVLQSDDEVEYTIYFIAGGTGVAKNLKICDAIPEGTIFVNGSISLSMPVAGLSNQPQTDGVDGDKGTFVNILDVSAPYNSPPCPNQNNPNGSVFVNLGNIPSAPSGQNVGFVRFRVKID